MHPESFDLIDRKVQEYLDLSKSLTVLDIGSKNVNGTYRKIFKGHQYTGVDMVKGSGVDLVLDDPYDLPFDKNKFDVVVCGQCFEHCEFFWLLFVEMCRVLKVEGKLFLIAPSRGMEHRFPVDCYRFYPDSMDALKNWANRNLGGIEVIDKGWNLECEWGDTWGVFTKWA